MSSGDSPDAESGCPGWMRAFPAAMASRCDVTSASASVAVFMGVLSGAADDAALAERVEVLPRLAARLDGRGDAQGDDLAGGAGGDEPPHSDLGCVDQGLLRALDRVVAVVEAFGVHLGQVAGPSVAIKHDAAH